MSLIRLKNISKTYQLGEVSVPVLKGISLEIGKGDFIALMGPSGSGKSTLMNILGCLDRPSSGEYIFDGKEIGASSRDERAQIRNSSMGFIFQSFQLLSRMSAIDNVLMPLSYSDTEDIASLESRRRAEELLIRVGLGDRMEHDPSQLSGGQQQRVAIARALINHPKILFADEPTGNLDSETTDEVLNMFKELHQSGITILIVTHEPEVGESAQRIVRVKDGRLVT